MVTDSNAPGLIQPDWPAPDNVHALVTLRTGGVSVLPYDSFNLAAHTGDDPAHVARNRQLLMASFQLPGEPMWLQQVHGNRVIRTDPAGTNEADGCWTDTAGQVCAVMTADCLPVFLCTRDGSKVAVAHAGWRGLAVGVIKASVKALSSEPGEILAWLGPAIGPDAFEVGDEVRQTFVGNYPENVTAFKQKDGDRWLCDIYALARIELNQLGVRSISGGQFCTFSDSERFFSFRRDGQTGRMASLIWFD